MGIFMVRIPWSSAVTFSNSSRRAWSYCVNMASWCNVLAIFPVKYHQLSSPWFLSRAFGIINLFSSLFLFLYSWRSSIFSHILLHILRIIIQTQYIQTQINNNMVLVYYIKLVAIIHSTSVYIPDSIFSVKSSVPSIIFRISYLFIKFNPSFS